MRTLNCDLTRVCMQVHRSITVSRDVRWAVLHVCWIPIRRHANGSSFPTDPKLSLVVTARDLSIHSMINSFSQAAYECRNTLNHSKGNHHRDFPRICFVRFEPWNRDSVIIPSATQQFMFRLYRVRKKRKNLNVSMALHTLWQSGYRKISSTTSTGDK